PHSLTGTDGFISDSEINASERAGQAPPLQGRTVLADRIAACIEGPFFRFGLVAQLPFRERCKIVGESFDGRAQFQLGEPAIGNRLNSGGRSKKIAGDRSCRITVSTVIYGEDDSVFKIFCSERAIDAHRQCFFVYEPFSKLTQRTPIAKAVLHDTFGFYNG